MRCIFLAVTALVAVCFARESQVDYTGHKVITVYPSNEEQLEVIKALRDKYQLDLWTEPKVADAPLMVRLQPEVIEEVEKKLNEAKIPFDVAIDDLQRAIESEKIANAPIPADPDNRVSHSGDFSDRYYRLSEVNNFVATMATIYSGVVTTIDIGKTFENRPIIGVKIGSDESKPSILIECGMHAREWLSVSSCMYIINELASKSGTNSLTTDFTSKSGTNSLISDFTFYIIPCSNPDGYEYSWNYDRMWRKTRSKPQYLIWSPKCWGADANRNFDIDHCGVGTSSDQCSEIYCGKEPFSEKEALALKNLIESFGGRLKAYFAVHAFSQLWMTPYGFTNKLPSNYEDLMRVCKNATDALKNVHGTVFKCGSISNIIYPATGSSVDWAYEKAGVKNSFALELRDTGTYGFMLPNHLIKPTCEETFEGIMAAVRALN